jgi:hypothetical protein
LIELATKKDPFLNSTPRDEKKANIVNGLKDSGGQAESSGVQIFRLKFCYDKLGFVI